MSPLLPCLLQPLRASHGFPFSNVCVCSGPGEPSRPARLQSRTSPRRLKGLRRCLPPGEQQRRRPALLSNKGAVAAFDPRDGGGERVPGGKPGTVSILKPGQGRRGRAGAEGGREPAAAATAATMSYQGKKNIPRITVSPGGRRSLPPRSLPLPAALRAGSARIPPASLARSPGRDGDPGSGWWRAAVSPAGATQTERPWGLGKTKQRGNPNSGAEKFGLFILPSHRRQERGARGSPRTPAPPGVSVCATPG